MSLKANLIRSLLKSVYNKKPVYKTYTIKKDHPNVITSFTDDYGHLSMFHRCGITVYEKTFISLAEAFFYERARSSDRHKMLNTSPRTKALKDAMDSPARDGWLDSRISVMTYLLACKYTTYHSLAKRLCETHPKKLLFSSELFKDNFWNVKLNQGLSDDQFLVYQGCNMFGILLELIRDQIRDTSLAPSSEMVSTVADDFVPPEQEQSLIGRSFRGNYKVLIG